MNQYTEYIVVANHTCKILAGYDSFSQAKKFATTVRQAGGNVTIFKSLEVKKPKGKSE